MSVQRYRMSRPPGNGMAYLAEDALGGWVEYAAHAATVAALEERVRELEAALPGLLGWFARHARLCGAQKWIDHLVALAPTEEGGRDGE